MSAPCPGQQHSCHHVVTPPVVAWMDRFALWPVIAAALLTALLLMLAGHASFERPLLVMSLNVVFSGLISLGIAAWIGRSFLGTGQPGLLLLGCGALIWGLSGSVGVIASLQPFANGQFNANTLVTIHNTCVWLSAMSHLTGAAISFKPFIHCAAPRTWLKTVYLGILVLIAFVTVAAIMHWTPPFFLPGSGGTFTRQVVLGSSIAMFLMAAILLHVMNRETALPFSRWYSLALLLFATGLTGIFFQKTTGEALGWMGRGAQYLGSLYMLVAVFRTSHRFRPGLISLEQTATGPVRQLGLAVAIAVASTAAALAVRVYFLQHIGTTLSYATFFPAVVLASFMGSFWAGVMTTALSTVMVFFFWNGGGSWTAFPNLPNLLDELFFLVSSLLVALAARTTDRAQTRAFLAEAEVVRTEERKRMNALLVASEERLAHVIDGTNAGTWDWNVQTGEVLFNERWAEIAGYSLEELMPLSIQTWIDLAHPADLQASKAQLDEVFSGVRTVYDCECRMKHRNGSWVWIHDRGKVIEWSEEGKPLRMTGSHTDITARKLAEERLNGLIAEQQIILETVPVGILKVVDRKLIWTNRALEAMLGYPKEELLLQPVRKIYPPQEVYDCIGQAAYPLLVQGMIYTTMQHLLRRDGSQVLVQFRGCAIDPADPAQGSIWTMEDITDRKQVEDALRERVDLFQALFVSNQMVNLLIDPHDGAIVDANPAATVYYGYSSDQLLSLGLDDIGILPSADMGKEIARAMEGWKTPFAMRHRLASGTIRDTEVYFSPIRIGDRIMLHAIIHDVSERKRLEAALHEHQFLLHSIFENTSDAIYVKDWAGRYLVCNTAAARFMNRPVDEVVGKDDRAFFSQQDALQIMTGEQGVLEAGEVRTYEEYLTLGGAAYTFLSTKGPVRNRQGAVIALFGIARDISERKRMEETHREQESNFRNLIETTTDMVVVATLQGRVLYTNRHLRDRLGYSQDDLAAMHLLALHPPSLRQEAEEITAAMLRGERDSCPLPVLTRAGVSIPVETRAWVGTWNGQECLFGFLKDLTREQEAHQRFERLFRNNPAAMALSSLPDRRLMDVNDTFVAISGYKKTEIIGKLPSELGLFREQSETVEALIQTIQHQGRFSGVALQVSAKDRIVHGLFSGEVISSQGKEYLLTVMIDITERKRMEDILRSREATLTAIIENQPGLLWLKDQDSRFLAVNTLFAKACGLEDPEDVVGKSDLDIWPTELAAKYMADDQATMRSGTPFMTEELVCDQGEEKWFETFKTPIFDEQGNAIGTTGFSRDITKRRHAEAVLQRAKDEALEAMVAKNTLLSTVAHEFRTPLSLLRSSLDILDRYGGRLNRVQREEQEGHIRSATRQLVSLSDTVLTFSRQKQDAGHTTAAPCDIRELCRIISEETRAAWAQGHNFRTTLAVDDIQLLLDAALFRRILENLLANAFQYTQPEKLVSLEVHRAGGALRLTVADEGIGMEEEDQPHVFTSLYRGRNVGQRRGMGLGLSIVRDAVQQMGGTITLSSTVGVGTTFVVVLPCEQVEIAPPS